jgi:hypothetical protein
MEKSREEVIRELASEHTVTLSTVATLLHGLQATGGNQVQFNISELGGMGQWQPSMVMVGDMFNHELKAKVDRLCTALSALSRQLPREVADTTGTLLGRTQATFKGSQNDSHYTYFAEENRLVIYHEGKNTSYDTTGYPLTGVQQAQNSGGKRLSFTYPGGTVAITDLKEIKS